MKTANLASATAFTPNPHRQRGPRADSGRRLAAVHQTDAAAHAENAKTRPTAATCEFVDLVTREEQLPSLYALLQYLMQVPKLDGETLPEFTDVPPCFTRKSEIVLLLGCFFGDPPSRDAGRQARDNVHHHHIFQYERHNRALMHPRGSILLRVNAIRPRRRLELPRWHLRG